MSAARPARGPARAWGLWALLWPEGPLPGLFTPRSALRGVDCVELTVDAAAQRYPGQVQPARPRGDYVERAVLACSEPLVPGREARVEAVLRRLDTEVGAIAAAAVALRPELAGRTWLVEPHDADAQLAAKMRFAGQVALVARGRAVSDRTPALAFDDVAVLGPLPDHLAWPGACARYAANGSVGPGDAVLVLASRDPRETIVHGGVCADGVFQWVR